MYVGLENMWRETLMALVGEQFDDADEIYGSTWYRESGEDFGENGLRCRWTKMGGRSDDGSSEWKETVSLPQLTIRNYLLAFCTKVAMIEAYLRANNMFSDYNEPQQERVYSSYLALDLSEVEPCILGPKRPHDRVLLKDMKADWHSCLDNQVGFKGFAVPKEAQEKVVKFDFHGQPTELRHGSVVIAAITNCTNTSNPSVMLGAELVAKKAYELGLEKYLNEQGFNIVGYGCTTCIGLGKILPILLKKSYIDMKKSMVSHHESSTEWM